MANALLKGLDTLTALARHPGGMRASDLGRRLHFPRTTVLRLLATLESYGLVARDGAFWRTTDRFHEWCCRDTHREIRERYHASLRRVAAEVPELVELGVAEGDAVRYIDYVQADHPITVDPRKTALHPLHRTASGKLILTQRPDLCAGLRDQRLQAELAEARRTGVAWNRGESDPNLIALATWIGPASLTSPVLCVKWPFFRFSEREAQRALAVVRRTFPENGRILSA